MKICFIASSGGHLDQLMMLFPIMIENDSYIVTEKTNYEINNKNIRCYEVTQVNRRELIFIFKLIKLSLKSLYIFLKEKPDVVISTGALISIPTIMYAKLFRKKIIFIESFSKVNSPTISGKIAYQYADIFIIQWEGLKKYYKNAIYKGGIY
ncbi:PssD/Cps14F family polysaccharide biosynthesis glycosyltransferase [Alkalicoccobacillus murimartini]|uniref:UDP-N-acetylglucosamine:LPS N-acetylglucosamine transferase n=1 Tax=Alkalicoccobacillus murimartini TaxID=171685 RepID=A0ABT9YGK2_9BACI|nr:PssD/Cps14F family polysaccharide biosynthesis glycosyltransferase [Alkalicoccobacillus murimartini]MDQ0206993.1 UDP-N-acetylglucosamine:LPS N-acetylglucosamine transferase [Alkalicoccobacillus murimartini]